MYIQGGDEAAPIISIEGISLEFGAVSLSLYLSIYLSIYLYLYLGLTPLESTLG